MERKRADILMVEQGLAPSRSRAAQEIKAGGVLAGGVPVTKPGAEYPESVRLTLAGAAIPYVSRGGLKLQKALDHFGFEAQGRVCLDVGASTGGFTDVLLRAGAQKVFAVDVGHGQLAPSLKDDPRVVDLEGVNARALDPALLGQGVDAVVADVSFISLTLVIPAIFAPAREGAWAALLVKPQFEVGKGALGKKGVVRDPALRAGAAEKVAASVAEQPGWSVLGTIESPIPGPEGNLEFLLGASKIQS